MMVYKNSKYPWKRITCSYGFNKVSVETAATAVQLETSALKVGGDLDLCDNTDDDDEDEDDDDE